MTDAIKEKFSGMVEATKGGIWKYLGAMMMETKGPNGEQAMSFTRVLGVVLFVCCLVIWMINAFTVPSPGEVPFVGDVPDGMLFTLWGLIGIKGAKDVAVGLKGPSQS